jgi:hypothetical protein
VHLQAELFGCFFKQLADSDWFVKSERFHSFVLVDCGFSPEIGFQKLGKRHPKIITFDLRENTFATSACPDLAKVLSARAKLLISECTFNGSYFAELFQALARHEGQSLALDCGHLKLTPNGWDNLFAVQPTLQISTLTELLWDGNRIDPWNVTQFTSFLRNQPFLSSLSISDCLVPEELNVVAPRFEDYFIKARCRLTSFTIRASTRTTTLNSPLVGLIKMLFRQHTLRSLDITGQNVGHGGLHEIIQGLPLAIENFWFDRNGIPSADALFSIVDGLLQPHKRWGFLSWPESDASAVQHQLEKSGRRDVARRIDDCREGFSQACRVVKQAKPSNSIIARIARYGEFAAEGRKESEAVPKQKVVAVGLEAGMFDSTLFRMKDDEVAELLENCRLTVKVDPIAAVFGQMHRLLTLEHLLGEQGGN